MPKMRKPTPPKSICPAAQGNQPRPAPLLPLNRQLPEAPLAAPKQRLLEISDLNYANAVWAGTRPYMRAAERRRGGANRRCSRDSPMSGPLIRNWAGSSMS